VHKLSRPELTGALLFSSLARKGTRCYQALSWSYVDGTTPPSPRVLRSPSKDARSCLTPLRTSHSQIQIDIEPSLFEFARELQSPTICLIHSNVHDTVHVRR
jgi:hypothetical protein